MQSATTYHVQQIQKHTRTLGSTTDPTTRSKALAAITEHRECLQIVQTFQASR